jgi:hypothetical protein
MALKEIGFSDGPTYLIPLDLEEWVVYGQAVRFRGQAFDAKREVHITVVNKDLGAKLEDLIRIDPKLESRIAQAIEEADWGSSAARYRRASLHHVVKEKKPKDGQGEPLHAESIVQQVEVPGLDAFYAALSAIVGPLPDLPPTHVTLYTLGDPQGIGLKNRQDWECYVKRELSPDELIRIE